MTFSEMAKARYSVVAYEEREVEREKVRQILATALAAPTACNFQPQRILLIDTAEKRAALKRAVPGKTFYVPLGFLVCYDRTKCWTRPLDGKTSGEIDASIAATHMMLQATDLGLGSIWVMNWDAQRMREEFSLPEEIEPVALLITGYAAPDAAPRPGHRHSRSEEEILI